MARMVQEHQPARAPDCVARYREVSAVAVAASLWEAWDVHSIRKATSPTGRRLQKKDSLTAHEGLQDFQLRREHHQIRVSADLQFAFHLQAESAGRIRSGH